MSWGLEQHTIRTFRGHSKCRVSHARREDEMRLEHGFGVLAELILGSISLQPGVIAGQWDRVGAA